MTIEDRLNLIMEHMLTKSQLEITMNQIEGFDPDGDLYLPDLIKKAENLSIDLEMIEGRMHYLLKRT